MRVAITINHSTILLPDDKGIQTIIRALAKGQRALDYNGYKNEIVLLQDEAPVTISVVYVRDDATVRIYEPKKEATAEAVETIFTTAKRVSGGRPMLALVAGGA